MSTPKTIDENLAEIADAMKAKWPNRGTHSVYVNVDFAPDGTIFQWRYWNPESLSMRAFVEVPALLDDIANFDAEKAKLEEREEKKAALRAELAALEAKQ